jgi:sRNA-binding carbon storage regulator CsrA
MRINGNQVRIGIDAPPAVNVVRTELLDSEHRAHRLKGSVLAEWSAAVDHMNEK